MLERRAKLGPFVEINKKSSDVQKNGTGGNELDGTGTVITVDKALAWVETVYGTLFGSPTRAVITIAGGTMLALYIDVRTDDRWELTSTVTELSVQIGLAAAQFSVGVFRGLAGASILPSWAQGTIPGLLSAAEVVADAVASAEGRMHQANDWIEKWGKFPYGSDPNHEARHVAEEYQ